jgi:ubiquinone/menaquinone biosynthesis C-methylase UbiE
MTSIQHDMRDTVKNIFDTHAQRYDDWFTRHQHAFVSECLALRKVIPDLGKGIEIGVGTGRFAQVLGIPFGVDISYPMLTMATGRGCYVAAADGESLPFVSGTFDYALLMVTLCFVKSPKGVLREAKRVLVKKGKIVIGIIDKQSALGALYSRKNSIFYRTARFYSAREVIQMLNEYEFHSIRTWQTLFRDPETMVAIDAIRKGYGKGGLVVISGIK